MFDFLSRNLSRVIEWVKGQANVTPETVASVMAQIKESFIDADVPYATVEAFLGEVEKKIDLERVRKAANPGHYLIKQIHTELVALLGGANQTVGLSYVLPATCIVLGLQGAGKTTTVAKLMLSVQKEAQKRGKKRTILCTSLDYYRPAARQQLAILAESLGIEYYEPRATTPVEAAREVLAYRKNGGYELLFVDTAGRLHVDNEMLLELIECQRILQAQYRLLVLDSMTGQESLNVARAFDQALSITGAVLSKADSDARGGAAVGFYHTIKKPIYYVGTGERVADLETFVPDRVASRLIGMGDLATLLEHADDMVGRKDQEDVARTFMSGTFTLKDFAQQMDMVASMGSFQKLLSYLPGVQNISADQIAQGQREMKKFRAIINSMTPRERIMPEILNGSRKKRIAGGAGVDVADVNALLQRFELSKQSARMFRKMGKFGKFS